MMLQNENGEPQNLHGRICPVKAVLDVHPNRANEESTAFPVEIGIAGEELVLMMIRAGKGGANTSLSEKKVDDDLGGLSSELESDIMTNS